MNSLYNGKLTLLSKNAKNEKIYFTKKKVIKIGSTMLNDVCISNIADEACSIEFDAFGRVTIRNIDKKNPIKVNGISLPKNRTLLDGSTIEIGDHKFRWELKLPEHYKNKSPTRESSDVQVVVKPFSEPPKKTVATKSRKNKAKCSRLTFHQTAVKSDEDDEDEDDVIGRNRSLTANEETISTNTDQQTKQLPMMSTPKTQETVRHNQKENHTPNTWQKLNVSKPIHTSFNHQIEKKFDSPKMNTPKSALKSRIGTPTTPNSHYKTPMSVLNNVTATPEHNSACYSFVEVSDASTVFELTPDKYHTPKSKSILLKSALKNSALKTPKTDVKRTPRFPTLEESPQRFKDANSEKKSISFSAKSGGLKSAIGDRKTLTRRTLNLSISSPTIHKAESHRKSMVYAPPSSLAVKGAGTPKSAQKLTKLIDTKSMEKSNITKNVTQTMRAMGTKSYLSARKVMTPAAASVTISDLRRPHTGSGKKFSNRNANEPLTVGTPKTSFIKAIEQIAKNDNDENNISGCSPLNKTFELIDEDTENHDNLNKTYEKLSETEESKTPEKANKANADVAENSSEIESIQVTCADDGTPVKRSFSKASNQINDSNKTITLDQSDIELSIKTVDIILTSDDDNDDVDGVQDKPDSDENIVSEITREDEDTNVEIISDIELLSEDEDDILDGHADNLVLNISSEANSLIDENSTPSKKSTCLSVTSIELFNCSLNNSKRLSNLSKLNTTPTTRYSITASENIQLNAEPTTADLTEDDLYCDAQEITDLSSADLEDCLIVTSNKVVAELDNSAKSEEKISENVQLSKRKSHLKANFQYLSTPQNLDLIISDQSSPDDCYVVSPANYLTTNPGAENENKCENNLTISNESINPTDVSEHVETKLDLTPVKSTPKNETPLSRKKTLEPSHVSIVGGNDPIKDADITNIIEVDVSIEINRSTVADEDLSTTSNKDDCFKTPSKKVLRTPKSLKKTPRTIISPPISASPRKSLRITASDLEDLTNEVVEPKDKTCKQIAQVIDNSINKSPVEKIDKLLELSNTSDIHNISNESDMFASPVTLIGNNSKFVENIQLDETVDQVEIESNILKSTNTPLQTPTPKSARTNENERDTPEKLDVFEEVQDFTSMDNELNILKTPKRSERTPKFEPITEIEPVDVSELGDNSSVNDESNILKTPSKTPKRSPRTPLLESETPDVPEQDDVSIVNNEPNLLETPSKTSKKSPKTPKTATETIVNLEGSEKVEDEQIVLKTTAKTPKRSARTPKSEPITEIETVDVSERSDVSSVNDDSNALNTPSKTPKRSPRTPLLESETPDVPEQDDVSIVNNEPNLLETPSKTSKKSPKTPKTATETIVNLEGSEKVEDEQIVLKTTAKTPKRSTRTPKSEPITEIETVDVSERSDVSSVNDDSNALNTPSKTPKRSPSSPKSEAETPKVPQQDDVSIVNAEPNLFETPSKTSKKSPKTSKTATKTIEDPEDSEKVDSSIINNESNVFKTPKRSARTPKPEPFKEVENLDVSEQVYIVNEDETLNVSEHVDVLIVNDEPNLLETPSKTSKKSARIPKTSIENLKDSEKVEDEQIVMKTLEKTPKRSAQTPKSDPITEIESMDVSEQVDVSIVNKEPNLLETSKTSKRSARTPRTVEDPEDSEKVDSSISNNASNVFKTPAKTPKRSARTPKPEPFKEAENLDVSEQVDIVNEDPKFLETPSKTSKRSARTPKTVEDLEVSAKVDSSISNNESNVFKTPAKTPKRSARSTMPQTFTEAENLDASEEVDIVNEEPKLLETPSKTSKRSARTPKTATKAIENLEDSENVEDEQIVMKTPAKTPKRSARKQKSEQMTEMDSMNVSEKVDVSIVNEEPKLLETPSKTSKRSARTPKTASKTIENLKDSEKGKEQNVFKTPIKTPKRSGRTPKPDQSEAETLDDPEQVDVSSVEVEPIKFKTTSKTPKTATKKSENLVASEQVDPSFEESNVFKTPSKTATKTIENLEDSEKVEDEQIVMKTPAKPPKRSAQTPKSEQITEIQSMDVSQRGDVSLSDESNSTPEKNPKRTTRTPKTEQFTEAETLDISERTDLSSVKDDPIIFKTPSKTPKRSTKTPKTATKAAKIVDAVEKIDPSDEESNVFKTPTKTPKRSARTPKPIKSTEADSLELSDETSNVISSKATEKSSKEAEQSSIETKTPGKSERKVNFDVDVQIDYESDDNVFITPSKTYPRTPKVKKNASIVSNAAENETNDGSAGPSSIDVMSSTPKRLQRTPKLESEANKSTNNYTEQDNSLYVETPKLSFREVDVGTTEPSEEILFKTPLRKYGRTPSAVKTPTVDTPTRSKKTPKSAKTIVTEHSEETLTKAVDEFDDASDALKSEEKKEPEVKAIRSTSRGNKSILLAGVKELMKTPHNKNNLSNMLGVKELLNTPKSGYDLANVSGVQRLFETPANNAVASSDEDEQKSAEDSFDLLIGKPINKNTYSRNSVSPNKKLIISPLKSSEKSSEITISPNRSTTKRRLYSKDVLQMSVASSSPPALESPDYLNTTNDSQIIELDIPVDTTPRTLTKSINESLVARGKKKMFHDTPNNSINLSRITKVNDSDAAGMEAIDDLCKTPAKKKSRQMQTLNDTTDMRGIKNMYQTTPNNDLRNVSQVQHLFGENSMLKSSPPLVTADSDTLINNASFESKSISELLTVVTPRIKQKSSSTQIIEQSDIIAATPEPSLIKSSKQIKKMAIHTSTPITQNKRKQPNQQVIVEEESESPDSDEISNERKQDEIMELESSTIVGDADEVETHEVENLVPRRVRRGRTASTVSAAENAEQQQSKVVELDVESLPKRARRGRNASIVDQTEQGLKRKLKETPTEVLPQRVARGRVASNAEQSLKSTREQDVITTEAKEVELLPKRTRRGRATSIAEESLKSTREQDIITETKEVESLPKRTRRGRAVSTVDQNEQSLKSNQEKIDTLPKRTRRGRALSTISITEPNDTSTRKTIKRKAADSKAASPEQVISTKSEINESKHEKITPDIEEEGQADAEQSEIENEAEIVKKPIKVLAKRGTSRKVEDDADHSDAVPEKITSSKRARGKSAAVTPTSSNIESENNEDGTQNMKKPAKPPLKRGRSKKADAQEADTSEIKTTSRRGAARGKNVTAETISSNVDSESNEEEIVIQVARQGKGQKVDTAEKPAGRPARRGRGVVDTNVDGDSNAQKTESKQNGTDELTDKKEKPEERPVRRGRAKRANTNEVSTVEAQKSVVDNNIDEKDEAQKVESKQDESDEQDNKKKMEKQNLEKPVERPLRRGRAKKAATIDVVPGEAIESSTQNEPEITTNEEKPAAKRERGKKIVATIDDKPDVLSETEGSETKKVTKKLKRGVVFNDEEQVDLRPKRGRAKTVVEENNIEEEIEVIKTPVKRRGAGVRSKVDATKQQNDTMDVVETPPPLAKRTRGATKK